MPTSRKRRPRKSAAARNRSASHVLSLGPSFEARVAADAAEARGSADEALWVMESPAGQGNRPWWRPWRRTRLLQLARWGELLPASVISRWILAQASQSIQSAVCRALAGEIAETSPQV